MRREVRRVSEEEEVVVVVVVVGWGEVEATWLRAEFILSCAFELGGGEGGGRRERVCV